MMQISPNIQSGKTLQSQLELHHHSRSSLYVQFHLYLHSSNHRYQWDRRNMCGMDDENNETDVTLSLHTAEGVAICCRLCIVFWISTSKDVEDILHFPKSNC